MLMKPCPRCKRMMPYGPAYCPECKPIAEAQLQAIQERNAKQKAAKYNRARDPKYKAFYNSKGKTGWKTLSRAYLQAAGYKCQAHLTADCQGIATEVHHVVPIQTPEGWARRLDWTNLEAVCTVCHNLRHPEKLRRATPDGVLDLRTLKD